MFYGANRPGAKVSQGMLDQFWLWRMQGSLKNVYDSIKAFSETDSHEDLEKFDVPTLVQFFTRGFLASRAVRTCKSLCQIHTPCSFPAERFLAERFRLRSTPPATELSCGDQLSK